MLMFIIIPFISYASCFKDIWGSIKYGGLTEEEQLFYWSEFLQEAQPITKEDRLWLLMARATRLNIEPKKQALKEITDVVYEFELELASLETPLEYACAGLVGLMYAKAPVWPKSIGSRIKAEAWMNKAKVQYDNPHVAFYLAFIAQQLGEINDAIYYDDIGIQGLGQECSALAQGRLKDLKSLRASMNA
jgi:hypothetical protein